MLKRRVVTQEREKYKMNVYKGEISAAHSRKKLQKID